MDTIRFLIYLELQSKNRASINNLVQFALPVKSSCVPACNQAFDKTYLFI